MTITMTTQDNQTITIGRSRYRVVHDIYAEEGYAPRYVTYLHGPRGGRYQIVLGYDDTEDTPNARWVAQSLSTYKIMEHHGTPVQFRKVADQLELI